jgi:hypothetical protein
VCSSIVLVLFRVIGAAAVEWHSNPHRSQNQELRAHSLTYVEDRTAISVSVQARQRRRELRSARLSVGNLTPPRGNFSVGQSVKYYGRSSSRKPTRLVENFASLWIIFAMVSQNKHLRLRRCRASFRFEREGAHNQNLNTSVPPGEIARFRSGSLAAVLPLRPNVRCSAHRGLKSGLVWFEVADVPLMTKVRRSKRGPFDHLVRGGE